MENEQSINVPARVKKYVKLVSINNDSQEDINSIHINNDDDENLLASVRRRFQISNEKVETGSLNVLSAKYESLDYDTCENHLLLDEERKKGYKFIVHKSIARWFIFLLIGMITALIACVIDISIEELSTIKYASLSKSVDKYVVQGKLYIPFGLWVLYNTVPVFVGSLLVTYGEPIAAGSGIPQVKCYLNGVKIPRVVRVKTLVVKSIGVICSVVGGLAGGKVGIETEP